MNNNLDKIRIVEIEKLSSEFYFQSLLEQAHAKGLLADSEIERLQYECLNLLAYKTERYNAGDSSSIRVEKAQDIMTSNLFTISLWLKTYPNPDDAVTALQNEPISEIYQKGCKRIDTMLVLVKTIHAKLMSQLVDTQNVFYSSTIDGGIKGFFELYYPDFTAHEIHITADYPTYNLMPKLAGIEFIQAYLNALYHENMFCSYFDPDDIHHLLCSYAEDYQDLLINIYEPVLTATLGCIIAGTDAHRLDISDGGAAYLSRLFGEISKAEILSNIQKAANELNRIFQFPHGLMQYIQSSLPFIAEKIEISAREQTLEHIFFTPAYPENKPKILFSFGDKMDNEQYRKMLNEIMDCRFSEDKIGIIKEQVQSLADLEDTLLDAYMTEEEIQLVFRELDPAEIAALAKRYLSLSDTETVDLKEQEQQLRKCLHYFISTLPQKQQGLIAKASKVIQEE